MSGQGVGSSPNAAFQGRAWPHGADSPHLHMYTGKIGHFPDIRVFHQTNVRFGVDGLHNTAEHLQNTPGTPTIHFLLVTAGSQSAL